MKSVVSIKITLLGMCLSYQIIQAQDMHFSQIHMSSTYSNPAITGSQYDLQAFANYKGQWESVTTPYTTFAASFDMNFNRSSDKNGFLAAGINCFSDKAGDSKMSTNQVNLSGAYHVFLNEVNTLGVGFQAGYAQRSVDYSTLQWGNQYDNTSGAYDVSVPSGENFPSAKSFGYPDFSTGVIWCYNNKYGSGSPEGRQNKANAGFSVSHFSKPHYSFSKNSKERLFIKYSVHANAQISVSNSFALIPIIAYYRQGPSQELLAGALLRLKPKMEGDLKSSAFSIGGILRTKDAVIPTIMIEFDKFALGLSYDVNTSKLMSVSDYQGGFEISFRFANFFGGKVFNPMM